MMDRKQRAELLRGREVRRSPSAQLECRSDDDGVLRLRGYACVTNVAYDMGWHQERISRGAFAKTLDGMPDVQLLINHEGLPLARTGRNMTLAEDDHGLLVEAQLDSEDPDVQNLARKMQAGLIDQMSFAFRVPEGRSIWDDDYENRTITECDVSRGDVSVVNQGANPFTEVSLRSLSDGLRRLAEGDSLPGEEWRVLADEFDLPLDAIEKIEARMRPANEEEDPSSELASGLDLDLARAKAFALRLRQR